MKLDDRDIKQMEQVGVIRDDGEKRSGSFVLVEDEVIESTVSMPGIEMYSTSDALKKYDWAKNYMWKLVDPDKDEYTRMTFEHKPVQGYFIIVKKGVKAPIPLQSCFYLKGQRDAQIVHNIIILEEDSELHIINGCTTAHYSNSGQHIGITEIFVGKNAFLSYTMIHDWASNIDVNPRSAVSVERDGRFISNYITMNEVHSLSTAPSVYLNGEGSDAKLNSIIYAPGKSDMIVGGKIIFKAENTHGEIISRVVSDGGKVVAPAELEARSNGAHGFMECSGMILNDDGNIYSQPALNSFKNDVELSHEASIGRIGQDELNYLMSRGINQEDARNLILHGFLNIKMRGLPDFLQEAIQQMIDQSLKGM